MDRFITRGLRVARRLGIALLLSASVVAGQQVAGQQIMGQQILVIGNDRGGYVGARAREIAALRASAVRVEIRGSVCFSACTMYLGADDVCVSPATRFGFHGPSRNGAPLDQRSFEHWTGVMARHYSEPLRQWFMESARYEYRGLRELPGTELIRLGYTPC